MNSLQRKVLSWVFGTCVVATPLWIGNQYVLLVACMAVLYIIGGLAWNLVGGYAGRLSLGHGIYFGLGAYTSTLLFLRLDISPWIGAIAGGIVAAIVALVLGYPCFRLRGPYYVLVTIGFLKVFEVLALKLRGITNGALGLVLPPVRETNWWKFQFADYTAMYVVGLVLAGIILAFTFRMERGRVGYYLAAIREDEDAAEAIGVNTLRWKLWAAAWSGFFTALAGTFYAQLIGIIDPYRAFSFEISLQFMLVTYVGGAATAWGPVVGAVLVTPLAELFRARHDMIPGLSLFLYGASLVIVVMWLRQGVLGALLSAQDTIERRFYAERGAVKHGHS